MSIDKESTGIPEVDPKRRTTKVNLFMIVAVAVFYALMYGLVTHYAHRTPDKSRNNPSPSSQTQVVQPSNQTGGGPTERH